MSAAPPAAEIRWQLWASTRSVAMVVRRLTAPVHSQEHARIGRRAPELAVERTARGRDGVEPRNTRRAIPPGPSRQYVSFHRNALPTC
jgi:hypothetical protein